MNDDASVARLKGRAAREPAGGSPRVAWPRGRGRRDPFADDTPKALAELVSPDVLVKEDYADKPVVGREWVESHGGQVVLALLPGRSTTGILEQAGGDPGAAGQGA